MLCKSFLSRYIYSFSLLISDRILETNLWSNNVPIQNNTASFIARGNKPKKFQFNLASMLVPTDKLHIEFYTLTTKKNRKKLFAIFDLILESLIDTKYIDIPEENLSDPNNYLISSTIQIKLYYTPPNIDREGVVLGTNEEDTLMIDFSTRFDEEGRHGGHRTRHVRSKNDSKLFVFILMKILLIFCRSFQN